MILRVKEPWLFPYIHVTPIDYSSADTLSSQINCPENTPPNEARIEAYSFIKERGHREVFFLRDMELVRNLHACFAIRAMLKKWSSLLLIYIDIAPPMMTN